MLSIMYFLEFLCGVPSPNWLYISLCKYKVRDFSISGFIIDCKNLWSCEALSLLRGRKFFFALFPPCFNPLGSAHVCAISSAVIPQFHLSHLYFPCLVSGYYRRLCMNFFVFPFSFINFSCCHRWYRDLLFLAMNVVWELT